MPALRCRHSGGTPPALAPPSPGAGSRKRDAAAGSRRSDHTPDKAAGAGPAIPSRTPSQRRRYAYRARRLPSPARPRPEERRRGRRLFSDNSRRLLR